MVDQEAHGTSDSLGRVLVVDDEKPLAHMIAAYLERAGFIVAQAHTGMDAVDEARRLAPDVIVLDLGLPGMDGLEVCQRIRTFSDCYILMLTARGDEEDRITGLTLGADDYITKPFSIRELITRIHAVLRRPRASTLSAPLTVGELKIDVSAQEVFVRDTRVILTRTECQLLTVLALHPGQALSRRDLIIDIWDTAWVGDERIIDVHIGKLRSKLGKNSHGQGFIETVRGVGYRLVQS
ncbi:MAG: response regulator transcription factor [Corynebacterium sp.]|nr:response regulator transcription factor [Corynebacterium sp.]